MGHGANPMGSTIAPPISVSISPSSARPPARRGEQVDEQDHQRREERRFLVLSEDWFSTPGFEWHPHSGLETVTLVLDGVLEHWRSPHSVTIRLVKWAESFAYADEPGARAARAQPA